MGGGEGWPPNESWYIWVRHNDAGIKIHSQKFGNDMGKGNIFRKQNTDNSSRISLMTKKGILQI